MLVDAGEELMEVVCEGTQNYALVFGAIVIISLHALLAFGTLSGVLLDSTIRGNLGIPSDQVALGNSLVFFGWIPGAILGGPLGDKFGRKFATIVSSLVASAGLCATGLVPEGSGFAFLAAKAMTGVGIGGFIAPSFTLLVESNDPRKKGSASVTWTWGYVAGVAILCGLHYGLTENIGVGWRTEELVLGVWGLGFAWLTQLFVTESPPWLFASGRTLEAVESAQRIAKWNGVDLDEAFERNVQLRRLRESADACVLLEEDEAFMEAGRANYDVSLKVVAADGTATTVTPLSQEERSLVDDACTALREEYSWQDLFSRENLPLTLTFGAMEVAYNLAFYVIIFSAGKFSDQVLLNLVLLAAADLPGSTLSGALCDRVGSKNAALAFLAAASVVLFAFAGFEGWVASAPSSFDPSGSLSLVPAALSLLGKSLCSGAFTAIFLLFNACYPVTLRSAALGSGNMFGKLGASLASPLTASFSPLAVLSVSGCALLVAAISATTLPERASDLSGEAPVTTEAQGGG